MEMRFRVFLREHLDDRVTATVLGIYGIVATAANREKALAGVRAQLLARLNKIGPTRWGQFEFSDSQALRSIEVLLRPAGPIPQDPIRITVNLLVTTEVRLRDTRYIVTAPRVPDLHLVVFDEDQIAEKAGAALATLAEKWESRVIVQTDSLGQEGLETITLTLPEADEALRDAQKPANTADQEDVLSLCGIPLSNPVGSPGTELEFAL